MYLHNWEVVGYRIWDNASFEMLHMKISRSKKIIGSELYACWTNILTDELHHSSLKLLYFYFQFRDIESLRAP